METEEIALARFMREWCKEHPETHGKSIPYRECVELYKRFGGKA